MFRRRRSEFLLVDQLDDRCLLSGLTGYTPAQITAAYGLNAITFTSSSGTTVTGNGSGETIALIEMYHDPNLSSDLAAFDSEYGLPTPTLTVDDLAGSQADSGWGEEESLDVEWAHAIAPGANILVVEAAPGNTETQELQNLMTAVQTANQTAGVAVVSMSWGFSEFPGETSYDSYFTTPGITYIASAGDSPGVSWPAASPNVVAVGGTSLTLTSSGAYGSETAWNSTGGGYSQYEAEPSYQESVQTTGERSTPDVAFDADPDTGVEVYFTPASGGGRGFGGFGGGQSSSQGSWQVVGGTSVGAPSWAGIIAIVDQGRTVAGMTDPNLTGSTQTLPSLYSLSSSDFHTVASSPTSTPGGGFGGFPWGGFGFGFGFGGGSSSGTTTGATANTQTGLGSPNGPSLINDLVASTITTTPTPTPTPTPSPTPTPTPTPTPSPTPTPTPTPTPSPTPIPFPGGHHHRGRPGQGRTRTESHSEAAGRSRIVKQETSSDEAKATDKRR